MAELKSCPFCGSDAASITHDHGTYEPGCTHCGTYIGCYSSERSAAAAWNRRPVGGEPVAYASSKPERINQLLSARQYRSCLPKNRADFDIPLYALCGNDAETDAEMKEKRR